MNRFIEFLEPNWEEIPKVVEMVEMVEGNQGKEEGKEDNEEDILDISRSILDPYLHHQREKGNPDQDEEEEEENQMFSQSFFDDEIEPKKKRKKAEKGLDGEGSGSGEENKEEKVAMGEAKKEEIQKQVVKGEDLEQGQKSKTRLNQETNGTCKGIESSF